MSSSTRSAGPRRGSRRSTGRDLAGTVVLVGVPTPDMMLDVPLLDVFGRGRPTQVVVVWRLACPNATFPMLIDLYLQGRLPLDKFVSEKIGIGDIEAAFEAMKRGDVLRFGGDAVTARIDKIVTAGTFSLDGSDLGRRQQTSGSSATTASVWSWMRRMMPMRSWRQSAVDGSRRSCVRTPTTTT